MLVPFTIFGAAFLGSGFFVWDTIKSNTICRYMECCEEQHVPFDLKSRLKILLVCNVAFHQCFVICLHLMLI